MPTLNYTKKHLPILDRLRGDIDTRKLARLILDFAVTCKALDTVDTNLLIKGSHQKVVGEKLAESFEKAQLSKINAEDIAAHIFSINETLRREITTFLLEESTFDESYAAYLQQLLLAKDYELEGVAIPSAIANLLVNIVCQNKNRQNSLLLCGNNSPEYTMAATKECQVIQYPTTQKDQIQAYLKLLFIAGLSVKCVSEGDMSIFDAKIKYEAAILSDPFGAGNYNPLLGNNKYKRLSSDISQLEGVIKRTDGRVVCLVRTGLLFMTSGDDGKFKQELLKSGQLEAVIQLPERLLTFTAMSLSVLVINTQDRFDKVTMIDATGPDFCNDINRSKRKLANLDSILALLEGEESSFKEIVPVALLLQESANIQVGRYVKTAEQKKAEQTLSKYDLINLQDIADIRVCQMIKSIPEEEVTADAEAIQQISQKNINLLGQIDAKATKALYPEGQENRVNNQRLRYGDILFSGKGIIGICGLVEESAVGMIPNQSFVIIRMRKNPYFRSASALFLYLRSSLCQTLLEAQVTGSAMKVIKTQDMKMIKVPIIDLKEQQALEQQYQSLLQLDNKRQKLEAEINEGLNHIWSS